MWIMFYVNCYLCSVCTETGLGNVATGVVVMPLDLRTSTGVLGMS